MIKLIKVIPSAINKKGFTSLNGLIPDANIAIISWDSLSFEKREFKAIKKEIEIAMNITFGKESIYILKSS